MDFCSTISLKVPTTTVLEEQKFESLVSQLVSKGNLTREEINELIRDKKSKVGGGYLTDQGALFLVASELGIDIDYNRDATTSISEIDTGANSVTLNARVLSIGLKVFNRKGDSGKGLLLRVVVFDNTGALSVNLWNIAAQSFLEGEEIKPGEIIRIKNAYAKRGLDGATILNLADKGKIERIPEEGFQQEGIKALDQMVVIPSSVPQEGRMMSVQGNVAGEVKKSTFLKSDGSFSKYSSFNLKDDGGGIIRAVIWNNSNPVFDSLKNNDRVTLLNVRTKISNFQNDNEVEIHGDDTTCVLERWAETRRYMVESAQDFAQFGEKGRNAPGADSPVPTTTFVARVVSVRHLENQERSYALLIDSQLRRISATFLGKASNPNKELQVDDLLVCKPRTFELSTLKASIETNSIVKSNSNRRDIPKSDSLLVRVEDVERGQIVSLELMCMSESVTRDIQTREGSIRRTEISVGDHTGEMRVYGWRDASKSLDDYSAGDRLMLRAVEVQSHEGKKFLVLKSYSSVQRMP